MRRVHIILFKHDDPAAIARRLVEEYGLQNLNEKRLKFFRIASGDMEPEQAEKLRAAGLVESVEVRQGSPGFT